MTDKFRVEPVIIVGECRYEVQRWNGIEYVTMYNNGRPLQFKLERMAELHLASITRSFRI